MEGLRQLAILRVESSQYPLLRIRQREESSRLRLVISSLIAHIPRVSLLQLCTKTVVVVVFPSCIIFDRAKVSIPPPSDLKLLNCEAGGDETTALTLAPPSHRLHPIFIQLLFLYFLSLFHSLRFFFLVCFTGFSFPSPFFSFLFSTASLCGVLSG